MKSDPNLSPEQVRGLLALVHRRVLDSWRDHWLWDDLRGAAYLGMWQAVRRWQRTQACALSTAAVNGARWGLMSYLRHELRHVNEARFDEDWLRHASGERGEWDRVAEQAEREQLLAVARAACTQDQWRALSTVYLEELGGTAAAAAMGRSRTAIAGQVDRGLARIRAALSIGPTAVRRPVFRVGRAGGARAGDTPNSRKTHCPRGHAYTPENTERHATGGGRYLGRRCRTCHREQVRQSRERKITARARGP